MEGTGLGGPEYLPRRAVLPGSLIGNRKMMTMEAKVVTAVTEIQLPLLAVLRGVLRDLTGGSASQPSARDACVTACPGLELSSSAQMIFFSFS